MGDEADRGTADRSRPRRGPAVDRGRWLAVAGVALVVALVGALLLVQGSGDGSDGDGDEELTVTAPDDGAAGGEPAPDGTGSATDASGGTDPAQEYLVPGQLPEGWEARYAGFGSELDRRGPPGGDVTAYGETATDDPWAGPVLVVADLGDTEPSFTDDAGEMTVAGRPATVEDDGTTVTLGLEHDGGHVTVTGYGFVPALGEGPARDAVVTAGEHLEGLTVAAPGLPDGYGEIASGPLSAMVGASGAGYSDGLVLAYGNPSGPEPSVGIRQEAVEDPRAAALAHLLSHQDGLTVESTEVRGRDAYLLRTSVGAGDGFWSVQWYEPSLGLLVNVTAHGTGEATAESVVEDLRPASGEELDRLLAEHDLPGGSGGDSTSTGAVPSGG